MLKNLTITLGVIVAMLQFTGFPSWIKNPLYFILGISIILVVYIGSLPPKKRYFQKSANAANVAINQNVSATTQGTSQAVALDVVNNSPDEKFVK